MKNFHTRLSVLWLVFLSSIPPIYFFVSIPPMDIWYVLILICGYAGLYTLFLRTDWKIKFVAIWSLVLCFLSTSAPVSFTCYVSIVLCCYFYVNCLRIENWKIIFQALQTVLFLNTLLIVMQSFGQDSLLNFGEGVKFTCYGVIGSHMQMGSFAILLCGFLLSFSLWNLAIAFLIAILCQSPWTFIAAASGGFVLLFAKNKQLAAVFLIITLGIFALWGGKTDKFSQNLAYNGRVTVWEQSWKYALKKPWTGWGPGEYKMIFPGLTADPRIHDKPYKTAHNWVMELLFETGVPFTAFMVWWVGSLCLRLWQAREIVVLAGLTMILVDGMVHFPDRMMQGIGIIICFLAYCEVRLKLLVA